MSQDRHPNFDDESQDPFGGRDYIPPPDDQPLTPLARKFENDNAPPQVEFKRPNGTLVRTYFPQDENTPPPSVPKPIVRQDEVQLQILFTLLRVLALMVVGFILLVGVLIASGRL